MKTIIVLGTGAARATHFYNTCFLLRDDKHNLLVDGGGGSGILRQLEQAHIAIEQLTDVFVSHEHIDHSFGVIWVIRFFASACIKGKNTDLLTIHAHENLCNKLNTIAALTLSKRQYAEVGKNILFKPVKDGEKRNIADHTLTFFDIHSKKAEQYGFVMMSKEGQKIVFCGDEPCPPERESLLTNADWLLHEAFCLDGDEAIFQPHSIGHGTVREAALLAERTRVKNLILWHTEDKHTKEERKILFTEEGKKFFQGNIIVPYDLESVNLFE